MQALTTIQALISAMYDQRSVLEKISADVVVVGYVDLGQACGLIVPRWGGARWATWVVDADSAGECKVNLRWRVVVGGC